MVHQLLHMQLEDFFPSRKSHISINKVFQLTDFQKFYKLMNQVQIFHIIHTLEISWHLYHVFIKNIVYQSAICQVTMTTDIDNSLV